jgi:hypothetical protein
MRETTRRFGGARLALAGIALAGGALLGAAVPAQGQDGGGAFCALCPGSAGGGGAQLAQFGPGGFPVDGGRSGFQGNGFQGNGLQGGGTGFPGGSGFPGGNRFQGQGGPGGRQGGVFGSSGQQTLASAGTIRMAAFCTDLLSDPPDGSTRFTGGGDATLVALADGRKMSLGQALASNVLTLRGHDDSFDPVRRDGSLALDIFLTNNSGMPVRLSLTAGTAVTPSGQSTQALPEGAERLFAAAEARRLNSTNTMQYAVWAARGSTAEEVEQANMIKLPGMEVGRVQSLLNGSGIRRDFDRNRGLAEAKYEEAVEKLGDKSQPISGVTSIPLGGKATVEGVRTADGKGFVTVKVLQSRARFFYGAQFSEGKDGRTKVKLIHLATGKPIHAMGGEITMQAQGAS